MALELTKQQQSAIIERGNILVSAAAGSGKTAVLVERVIGMLTDEKSPVDANRLLIVTFTNAAAAEMRSRIEKRLAEECDKNPTNFHLLKQKHLISSAKICTIDSFCIDLIRENFEMLGVSPDFKMSAGNELSELTTEVYSQLINEYLTEYDEEFRDLLDITGCEYDEQNFIAVCRELFLYSQQMPFPKHFLDGLYEPYNIEFNREHPWFRYAMDYAKGLLQDSLNSLAAALELSRQLGLEGKYAPMLIDMAEQIRAILDAVKGDDWDRMSTLLEGYSRMRAPSIKDNYDISKLTAIKDIYSGIDATIKDLREIFECDKEGVNLQIKRLREPISLLIKFINELTGKLFERQLQENIFTFYNTEQMAMELLCEYRDGDIVLRESATPILERFDEILVDEYQDTNDLQDTLFKVLSSKGGHLFVVGDIKQSIYGFRGANPNNFLNKKNEAKPLEECQDGAIKKIILSKNFRSRDSVCSFVNFFFKKAMNEQTGNIIYNEEEWLTVGGKFPECHNCQTELLAIDMFDKESNIKYDHLELEAKRIAEYIRSVMSSGRCIRDTEDTLREARYSDFAILMRFSKNYSSALAEHLKKQGIPVSFSQNSFLETTEITTALALLKVVDNPDSDISLLTVMMSPMFSFTAEDMAKIRANKKTGSLLSAVQLGAQQGDTKAQRFLTSLSDFRRIAATESLPRFISKLFSITDYSNIVLAMEDGERKHANLQLLIGYAADFSKNSSLGLGGFLKYMESMSDDKITAAKIGYNTDSVTIMSMHMSKGLQFPICILADTVTSMHNKGGHSNCIHCEGLGLGVKYFDEEASKKCETLGYKLASIYNRQVRMQEELRILYVAMTRAEERLAFVCCENNLTKKLNTLSAKAINCFSGVNGNAFYSADSMSDWLLLVSLMHSDAKLLRELGGIAVAEDENESRLIVSVKRPQDLCDTPNSQDANTDAITSNELIDSIRANISYKYPFEELYDVEAKTTVSALANKAEQEKFAFSATPDFLLKSGVSASGRGSATHKIMQLMDIEENIDIADEIKRLQEMHYISEHEASAADIKAIERFLESSLYKRMLKAETLKREMRFLTEIPASAVKEELTGELRNETVMVQGAVDLCFIEPQGVVVVDFKTDRVTSETELTTAYSEQLEIYAKACSKIFERPVKQKIIYSFALGREIVL